MKKALLVASIATALLSTTTKSKAQTVVSAGGRTIKLTSEQVTYLHGFNNPAIDSALKSTSVKYNATADLIMAIISKRQPAKKVTTYIAKQN